MLVKMQVDHPKEDERCPDPTMVIDIWGYCRSNRHRLPPHISYTRIRFPCHVLDSAHEHPHQAYFPGGASRLELVGELETVRARQRQLRVSQRLQRKTSRFSGRTTIDRRSRSTHRGPAPGTQDSHLAPGSWQVTLDLPNFLLRLLQEQFIMDGASQVLIELCFCLD